MVKKKKTTSYDAEAAAARKEAGIKRLTISVPDLCRAVPGGIGEGAYVKVSVLFPMIDTGNGCGELTQYYTVGRRGRLEYVEDRKRFFQKLDDLKSKKKTDVRDIKCEKPVELFTHFVTALEYRSREETEELMQKIVALIEQPAAPQAAPAQPAQQPQQTQQQAAPAQPAQQPQQTQQQAAPAQPAQQPQQTQQQAAPAAQTQTQPKPAAQPAQQPQQTQQQAATQQTQQAGI